MIRSIPARVLVFVSALATSLVFLGPSTSDSAPDSTRGVSAPDLDSARAELEIGRYWHAARHLRALRADGFSFGPGETLLLARADAGWRNWDAVAEALGGQEWLAEEDGGLGLRLLGEAYESREAWDDAELAFALYLSSSHGRDASDRTAIMARRARALSMAGESEEALEALEVAAEGSSVVASWQALAMAEEAASSGDTAVLRRLAGMLSDVEARDRAWRLEAASVLAAGDTVRAIELHEDLSRSEEGGRRATALNVLGALALARGDTATAVAHSRAALDLGPGIGAGVAAARRLVDLDSLGADRALVAGRTLAGAGADRAALAAYDLHVRSVGSPAESVRLDRARLMADVESRHEDAVTEFRALSTSADPEVGAGALDAWIRLRRSQGRAGDVRTLQGWLVERYPASAQAVNHVFLRGDAAHDRGELDEALRDYGRLQEVAPSMSRSGLARMRMAQIHVTRGDHDRALDVFGGYLSDFPEGRRWTEAAYWTGKLHLERGEREEGARHLRSVIEREPLSYYAVLASDALDVPYELPAGPGGGTPPLPGWMESELETVDLLAAAGLEEGRSARTDALVERALDTSPEAALRLAGELIRRDHSLDGINLGWELRNQGMEWSRALLEVTYPLPHREMVERAARERDLDPVLVAALIRQESAFDPDIVSHAGAVGLMQIMPATGRQLAAAVGPSDFNVESLETPEINLHLGTRYLVDLLERFDGSLPLVLSAYNAGPHRAQTWLSFPEAEDPLRFTERIPYGETRDYVKLVTRNMALYRELYGDRPAF